MASTINGTALIEADITEPRVGTWTATVEADTDEAIEGAVTIDIDGETFVGTVVQGALESERWKGTVVGGAGGLRTALAARSYTLPGVNTVLNDVMRESGEALDSTVGADVLGKRLPFWTRLSTDMHSQLRQLCDELGVDWRMTRAGKVWLGTETWPTLSAKYIEVEELPEHRASIIAYEEADNDQPVIRPGVTLDGRRVQRVQTKLTGDGLRQVVFFDEESGESGLVATVLRRVREMLLPKIFMSRIYGAKVVSQIADGTLDLQPDDDLVAGKFKSVGKVPPVFGLPGITIQAAPGAKVRLWWDAGRPSRPRTGLWDQAAPVNEITITVADRVRIVGNLEVDGDITATGEVTAMSATPATAVGLSTHLHATPLGPTAPPTAGT